MKTTKFIFILFSLFMVTTLFASQDTQNKKLAYIVSDIRIPFWQIMAKGIQKSSSTLNYELHVYSSNNIQKNELEFTIKAIKDNFDGIIVSPINSSACVTILKLARQANIPVVISDIGTDKGEYVTYVSSDNIQGSYDIGKVLAKKMYELGWKDGTVGIVAIPQKRLNGQQRTAGFLKALDEYGIKAADIKQQIEWTEEETYNYSIEMINKNPELRAIWLQGSDRYNGALRAIKDSNKENDILLITFDAEPIFLELIPKGILTAAAMQQPYLMGQKAVESMHLHLNGKKVEKKSQLPILVIYQNNIEEKLPIIKRNVLGMEGQ